MKNDQEGSTCFPRHVYCNPSDPVICPILRYKYYYVILYINLKQIKPIFSYVFSIAILLFSTGQRSLGSSTLLFGLRAQDRFSKWLDATCTACSQEMIAMGLSMSDIGTHSFRKGVASVLSGFPGGPQAVSIWLRAGWSLGAVQGRYIFAGSGGDQFVGRAATGTLIKKMHFVIINFLFTLQNYTMY